MLKTSVQPKTSCRICTRPYRGLKGPFAPVPLPLASHAPSQTCGRTRKPSRVEVSAVLLQMVTPPGSRVTDLGRTVAPTDTPAVVAFVPAPVDSSTAVRPTKKFACLRPEPTPHAAAGSASRLLRAAARQPVVLRTAVSGGQPSKHLANSGPAFSPPPGTAITSGIVPSTYLTPEVSTKDRKVRHCLREGRQWKQHQKGSAPRRTERPPAPPTAGPDNEKIRKDPKRPTIPHESAEKIRTQASEMLRFIWHIAGVCVRTARLPGRLPLWLAGRICHRPPAAPSPSRHRLSTWKGSEKVSEWR